MSRFGYGAIAADAIGAHPDLGTVTADPLRQKLARGEEVDTVILIQIRNRPVTATGDLPAQSYALGSLAIGAAPDLLSGASADEVLFISDGVWCGRPDDFGAAHWEANPIVIEIGDLQDDIPYLPEQDRRATTTIASVRAANGDGALDDYLASRTTDGLLMRGFLAEDNGYSRDWLKLFEALGSSADPGLDECLFQIDSITSRLEVPALQQKFTGLGGSSGDARLADRYVPLMFGDGFNVPSVIESYADNIDRWSAGSLIDITVVKDKGAPLIWDGQDHADYVSLKNATVAPGYFTKALAIGRSKRGSAALGKITGDIRAPYNTTAEVCLALARGAAALSEDLIDAGAWGVIPDYPIDLYLSGERQVQVDEIFDALLRPFNAWYGENGDARLTVGRVLSPVGADYSWEVEGTEIYEGTLGVEKFDEQPRWRMGMSGARNWTPMTPDELVDWTENDNVSQADWERLQREYETAEAEDSAVKQRHPGAFDALEKYGALRTYFTDVDDLQLATQAVFEFLKRPMRKVSFEAGLQFYHLRPGENGSLQYSGRLELSDGRPGVAVTRRFNSSLRSVAATALMVVNSL